MKPKIFDVHYILQADIYRTIAPYTLQKKQ